MKFDYFASCPRGLEKILSDELKKIKAVSMIEVDGGVSFSGSLETMYRANLESRIATRILFRLKKGGMRVKKIFIILLYLLNGQVYLMSQRVLS